MTNKKVNVTNPMLPLVELNLIIIVIISGGGNLPDFFLKSCDLRMSCRELSNVV